MSRMTAAQVIGLGEYLEPDFDPASLTVSQLLGILSYHNVEYPTPYTKPKLVTTFNSEIKTRAAKFKKERIAKENSIASEDGIKDGITGRPLRPQIKSATSATRRSSRRSSVNPMEPSSPTDEPTPQPGSSKRRRSSAQPSLGGSRRTAHVAPTLVEESEPEDEEEREAPPRKVGRTKKTTSAAGHSRRVSHISGGEDSGWEDNNIFQSGAESSSPARPSPAKPRLSKTSPKRGRKSTSAPPQISPPSSPYRPSIVPNPAFRFSPPPVRQLTPVRDITPEVPSREPIPVRATTPILEITPARAVTPIHDITPPRALTPIRDITPARAITPIRDPTPARGITPLPVSPLVRESAFHRELTPARAFSPAEAIADEYKPYALTGDHDASVQAHEDNKVIDEALALMEAEQDEASSRAITPFPTGPSSLSWSDMFWRILTWACILTGTWLIYGYKTESSSIAFCDRGSNSNAVLDKMLSDRENMYACIARNLTGNSNTLENSSIAKGEINETCPFAPLLPLPHPSTCTKCPDHATCSRTNVVCDTGFLMKPHILLSFVPVSRSQSTLTTAHVPALSETFFQVVSTLSDGLPGFGSVGFPPRCVADPQRKASIGKLGNAIEAMLAKERGRRICRGGLSEDSESTDGPEAAVKWGVEVEKLKDVFKKTASDKMLPQFDEMFNEAMQQLTQWGGVFIGESTDGTRYAAHKFPVMSLECMITVKARNVWKTWRSTVLSSVVAILLILGARVRMIQNQKENKRVAGLVQVALDTIRNQELAHYTDPLTTPQPYLSSIQLRDLVLQDEHSVSTRKRLWDRVEAIVEENANVRVNLEEIDGGDELRVWRWVGTAGPTRTPGRKEVEYEYQEEQD